VTYEYPPFVYGGAGTYASSMVRALAGIGVEVHVVCPGQGGAVTGGDGVTVHRIPSGGIGVLRIPRFWFGIWSRFSKFARDAGGFDAVIGNGFSVLPLKGKKLECPLVTVMHQSARDVIRILQPSLPERLRNIGNELGAAPLFDPALVRRADHLVAVSEYVKGALMRDYGVCDNGITVIPNGFDDKAVALAPGEYETLEGQTGSSGRKKLLFVGRPADKRKGLSDLIDALALVEGNPVLLVAGKGDTSGLAQRAARAGVADSVRFLGFVDDGELSRLYAFCDLFVSSSHYESFGLTLVEAMSAGKPVVARDVGGTSEVVREDTGLLVRGKRPEDLADVISSALNDPELGANNRDYVLQTFSWDASAKALADLVQMLAHAAEGTPCLR
jgi:glycosyltransferase involved in cell wall biosynthesis